MTGGCNHAERGEGRYIRADVRNLKDDWHVDVYLRGSEGVQVFPYRDYRFKFWVDSSHDIKGFLSRADGCEYGIASVRVSPKPYRGRCVYEVVMANPYYRSAVRDKLRTLGYRLGHVEPIGLDRSIDEDFRRAFFPPWRSWLAYENGQFTLKQTEPPKLRKMYWDIEVDNIKPDGTVYLPKADNIVTPVISSATHAVGETEVATFVDCPLPYISNVGSESAVLDQPWQTAAKKGIDALIGYNIDGYDFPVVERRAAANGLPTVFVKGKGGVNYVYHVRRVEQVPKGKRTVKKETDLIFQTLDMFPIINHKLYPMPAGRLKDAERVFLGREPMDYGAQVGRLFRDPTRRLTLFKYAAEDVQSLAEIDEKLGLMDAIDELCPVLRQWPEGFRKTSDDLCKHFVYGLYGPDDPIADTEFAGRDWSKIKGKFVIDQHKYGRHAAAARVGTNLVHLFTINSMRDELTKADRSEIVRAADELRKLIAHYRERWEGTKKPMYKTAGQMLRRIGPGLVSTIASEMYEWYDEGLSEEYQKRFRQNIEKLGAGKILWAGFDEMFIDRSSIDDVIANSRSFSYGQLLEVENIVPLCVRDKQRRIYYDPQTDQLYPKRFSLARKTWSPIVNRSTIALSRTLLIEGEPAAQRLLIELGNWIRSGQYSKDDTTHNGFITKPEERYSKELPQVKAARMLDGIEPYQQIEWGLEYDGDEERIVPINGYNPKPDDIFGELVKRLEPIMWDEQTVRHLLAGQTQSRLM